MNDAKDIGLDVHQATISATVLDSTGKLVMESILETKAATILQFIHGLRGSLHVTFKEGTCAAWLHDLLKPHLTQVLVWDPRKNALLKVGNKSDRIDSRKLAELLRSNLLRSVYHEETGVRTVKELARSYLTITKDLTRVMTRLKAIYRSWAIPCAGQQVYAPRHRAAWLAKISEAGVRRRAELYYQQLVESGVATSLRCVSCPPPIALAALVGAKAAVRRGLAGIAVCWTQIPSVRYLGCVATDLLGGGENIGDMVGLVTIRRRRRLSPCPEEAEAPIARKTEGPRSSVAQRLRMRIEWGRGLTGKMFTSQAHRLSMVAFRAYHPRQWGHLQRGRGA